MSRLKFYAATFAVIIGLSITFTPTARAEGSIWESILSVFSSANAAAVCTTNPVVVNNADSGAGSLRQAVIDACPGSTINISVTGTIPLTTGRIVIDKNLTIRGPGVNLLTVRDTGLFGGRIFQVNSGVTATLAGLSVTDGSLSSSAAGSDALAVNQLGILLFLGDNDPGGNDPPPTSTPTPTPNCTTNPVVTNNAASGAGSLRQAVIDACPGSTITFAVTGMIPLSNDGQITIDKNLTIQGPGANLLTVWVSRDQPTSSRIFQVNPGVTATLAGLTVTGGSHTYSDAFQHGAGIKNEGNLTLADATITGNDISWGANSIMPKGGGIYNAATGTLTITNSIISNNSATGSGGGIFNDSGTVTVTKSIITGNRLALNRGGGGGISNYGGVVTVTDSTVSLNRSGQTGPSGGGLKNDNGGTITLINSTVSNNKAEFVSTGGGGGGGGGGIQLSRNRGGDMPGTYSTVAYNRPTKNRPSGGGLMYSSGGMMMLTSPTVSSSLTVQSSGRTHGGGIANVSGTVNLINSTIMSNTASTTDFIGVEEGVAGIYNVSGATINSRNSIIAGSGRQRDYFGTLTSQGYNLLGNDTDTTITGDPTGNIVGTNAARIDPRLAPLADNGGPTQTHALLADSLAINAGSDALAVDKDNNPLTTDQRGAGFPRIVGASVDIGAFESDSATPNTAPSAVNDISSVDEDSTLTVTAPGVLANDTDGENNALTAQLQTSPAHAASFALNADGSFSYTPNPNFNGTDSFTYTASDGNSASNAATVTITVTAVNDNPDAISDSATVAEDSGASAINVLGNDSLSPDSGETLTVTAVTQGTSGAVAITNSGAGISYTPAANYTGADSFTYTISDGNGGSDTATVNVTVTSVNDNPDAADDSATVNEDSGATTVNVLANDDDAPDTGETLSVSTATNGANGTVAVTNGGADVSYTPNAGFSGSDSFTYTISDGNGGTDTATVNVTVTAVNDAPVLNSIGNKTTDEGATLTFTATGNDDADSPNPNSLSFSLLGAPAGATITAAGAFSWTPSEAQGPGTFTFRVRVTDNGTPNLFDDEEITVTVREVNAAPVLGAIGNGSGVWGNALGFTATATDSDLPANTLIYTLTGAPSGASISAAGVFMWTPTSAQLGTHTFTVQVTDNGTPALSDSETITITIGKRPTVLVYGGATTGQYSDSAALTATLADNGGGTLQGTPIAGKTVSFTLGTQAASEATNTSGVAGKSLILTQAAQALNVVSQFGGDAFYNSSGDSDPFTINKEDVETSYTGDSLIFTAGPTVGTASSVRLAARLTQLDSELGDLTLARVRFEVFKFSNSSTTPTVIFGNIAVDAAGNAETTAALAVDDAYTVRVVIEAGNGYWRANPAGESTLVVAYGTTERRVTGGGWVPDAASVNNKGNFGFTVNYQKSGAPKGNSLYLFRGTDGYNYRVKSNSWQGGGLTFYGEPWKAAFSGKCNVQKIDPLTGATVQSWGGYTFTVDLIDGDLRNPRETDRYAIQVLTEAGAVWKQIGTRTNPVALGGGNVAVKSN